MRFRRRANSINESSQQSVYYLYSESLWSRFSKKERDHPNMYEHMFIEDISVSIFSLRKGKDGWIGLEIKNDEYEELITAALDDSNRTLKDAIWDFVYNNHLVYSLLKHQRAYYEIVYYDDGTFRFIPIPNYTIIRLFGIVFQYIPNHLRKNSNKNLPVFLRLNSKNLFYIDVPKKSRNKLPKIMKGLSYISHNSTMPDFARRKMMDGNGMYPLDYGTYHKRGVHYIAKLTKDIGWSGRSLFKDEELEYYNLFRFLRFEQFKYEFRVCIIEGLNRGLRRVNRDWVTPQLVQNIFPQQDDIQNSFQQLHKGSVKFNDLITPYLAS